MRSAAVSIPFVKRARAEDAILNVYNRAEEMQAKMLAGSTGYDVVDMAGLTLPNFIKAGIYQKLDMSKQPN